jgi:hypothetical protein
MTWDEVPARPEGVADWELERYVLGELPGAEMERLRGLAARDATLRLRIDALERSSETILDQDPPGQFAAGVKERLTVSTAESTPRHAWRVTPYAWVGAAAAVVATIAVLTLGPGEQRGTGPFPSPENDVTHIKGLDPRLEIFRQTGAGAEELSDGSAARLDDVVQIAYQAAGLKYGVIVSIDGRGVVTVHYPSSGEQAAELGAGRVALPQAYRLDDAPRFERFFLVTSNQPFTVARVVSALRAAANATVSPKRLALPSSMKQTSLELKKES